MGIAMAVLVLEASRARTEELNDKLRQLALITAEATHSFRAHETLSGVFGAPAYIRDLFIANMRAILALVAVEIPTLQTAA